VVIVGELTDEQRRMAVDTGLEDRILDAILGEEPPELVLISGSAGGGKSLAIANLLDAVKDAWGVWIEDATHAESPRQDQVDRLERFFEPFADGAGSHAGSPHLIAMNTGMVIRFFACLRRKAPGGKHRFSELEAVLKARLGLAGGDPRAADELPLSRRVLVINLDHRPTAGGDRSLFAAMLRALDPSDPAGVMAGAPRCATCQVRAWCFVRTNAEVISSEPTRSVLDSAADRLALERARPLPPRALWDLAAALVTGGEPFPEPDPCDRIAQLARADDGQLVVWDRLINNGAFITDPAPSWLAARLAELDPSYAPSEPVHELLAAAGIDAASDARALRESLGSTEPASREAVDVAAQALAGCLVERAGAGRSLVRAAFLAGSVPLPGELDATFTRALDEYGLLRAGRPTPALDEFLDLVAAALVRGFGEEAGLEHFFHIEALNPQRRVTMLVRADLRSERELLRIIDDPVLAANPRGAGLAGYRPLAITVRIADVTMPVGLPLFRVLAQAASGSLPSTADLERFFALRRAVEAVGRIAATDRQRPLLISDQRAGRRFRAALQPDVRGQDRLVVREVV
jgi:hypothetical protein